MVSVVLNPMALPRRTALAFFIYKESLQNIRNNEGENQGRSSVRLGCQGGSEADFSRPKATQGPPEAALGLPRDRPRGVPSQALALNIMVAVVLNILIMNVIRRWTS